MDAKYIWQDLRKETKTVFCRHSGCSGSIVWGAINSKGKRKLDIVRRTLNDEGDLNILETLLLPFTLDAHGNYYMFIQDNFKVYRAQIADEVLRIITFL